ncbi:MAG: UDP-N-acetylmuramoyl-L-alanine--D-glutamate ligase [Thermonemataceae bacterium]|nr:UDP-N-acetylmuramoyl-L-alanine--D-glutamate ligase [Thermonemataceae bacterium]
MKKIIILGAGESGVGAALLAKAKNYDVFVSDSSKISEHYRKVLEENQIAFEEENHSTELILTADEVIKSPGISGTAAIILAIQEQKIPIISEIEFAFRCTKAKIIAITGSNGKTTTTLLAYHLLKNAGINVGLGGNVGKSFALQVLKEEYDYYVLEISSFQLDDTFLFKPYISVILNITPDHLDRYDYNFDKYADAKFKIMRNQGENDFAIYNADSEAIEKRILKQKPIVQQLAISLNPDENLRSISKISYYQEGKITLRMPYNRPSQITLQEEEINLRGKHNLFNAMAATLIAQILGLSLEKIKEGLATFEGVPHRLEEVAEVRGVRFINDSKATNVDSVFYALDSFSEDKNIIWIAGGVDKGNEYSQIEDLVKSKVKLLLALGKDNQKLLNFFEGKLPIIKVDSMEKAVKQAFKEASRGDTVLLSPACASFDLFKNYEDRGEQFKLYVKKLK